MDELVQLLRERRVFIEMELNDVTGVIRFPGNFAVPVSVREWLEDRVAEYGFIQESSESAD